MHNLMCHVPCMVDPFVQTSLIAVMMNSCCAASASKVFCVFFLSNPTSSFAAMDVPRRVATLWLLHNDWIAHFCRMSGCSEERAEKAVCVICVLYLILLYFAWQLCFMHYLLSCRLWTRSRRTDWQVAKWRAPRSTTLIDFLRMSCKLACKKRKCVSVTCSPVLIASCSLHSFLNTLAFRSRINVLGLLGARNCHIIMCLNLAVCSGYQAFRGLEIHLRRSSMQRAGMHAVYLLIL